MEIKLPLGGIIEIVGRGKLDQILRSQEIGCVLRVIVAEPTLISRHKVFVFGYATGQPAMSGGRFEIPYLILIHEAYAETFGYSVAFDQTAEPFHAFACRADIWQCDVEYRVFSHSVLHQWVGFECFVAAENTLGGAHSHACRIESGAAPMARQMAGGQRAVTQST